MISFFRQQEKIFTVKFKRFKDNQGTAKAKYSFKKKKKLRRSLYDQFRISCSSNA